MTVTFLLFQGKTLEKNNRRNSFRDVRKKRRTRRSWWDISHNPVRRCEGESLPTRKY